MADPLTLTAMALTAGGTLVTAGGQLAAGKAAQEEAQFRATQQEMRGREELAASQRESFALRDRKERALSTLRARAAASGGSSSDAGVVKLGEDIEQEGEMQALTAMWKGENAYRGFQDAATGSRMTGRAARTGSYFAAGGTLLSGGGSLLSKYG